MYVLVNEKRMQVWRVVHMKASLFGQGGCLRSQVQRKYGEYTCGDLSRHPLQHSSEENATELEYDLVVRPPANMAYDVKYRRRYVLEDVG
jgi:hypothetical protein